MPNKNEKGSKLMLEYNDIAINVSCQHFICKTARMNVLDSTVVLPFVSTQQAKDVRCRECGSPVHVHSTSTIQLRDAPIFAWNYQKIEVTRHRYRCTECGKTFQEDLGLLQYPGTRITVRAARFVRGLLRFHISLSTISCLLGIRWNTLRFVQEEWMKEQLAQRKQEQDRKGYRPRYLAIDEFAIHRGHTYATCVMDLDEGDILWAGMGRSMKCFEQFFRETDLEYLSNVKAIAMDMNASYHNLVQKYLPGVEIVYDRYHMQAQFGKDVLGSVRLEEAKEHREKSIQLKEQLNEVSDPEKKQELKQKSREELKAYTRIKSSRWPLLRSAGSLSETSSETLAGILENHKKLSVCYAMKEEMGELFNLKDPEAARAGWETWFRGAKESGIPQLVHFAELKEKRMEGLISHAKYQISTGKLEGFNNKIKAAKRIGYGFRNNEYFFLLIRYLSIPWVRAQSHSFC